MVAIYKCILKHKNISLLISAILTHINLWIMEIIHYWSQYRKHKMMILVLQVWAQICWQMTKCIDGCPTNTRVRILKWVTIETTCSKFFVIAYINEQTKTKSYNSNTMISQQNTINIDLHRNENSNHQKWYLLCTLLKFKLMQWVQHSASTTLEQLNKLKRSWKQ